MLSNFRQVKISAPPDLGEPIGFDQFPDGRIVQTNRRGAVLLHDPANGSTQTIADLPVYTNSEDGLYGPAVDNNFSSDHWVYLYYAPLVANNITYSDGTTGHTNDFTALTGRRPRPRPSISALSTPGSATSSSRASSSSTTHRELPAHLDLSTEQQILRVPEQPRRLLPRGRRHRLRQAQQPLARHG